MDMMHFITPKAGLWTAAFHTLVLNSNSTAQNCFQLSSLSGTEPILISPPLLSPTGKLILLNTLCSHLLQPYISADGNQLCWEKLNQSPVSYFSCMSSQALLLPFKVNFLKYKPEAVHFCLTGCCLFICQPTSVEYIARKGQTCSTDFLWIDKALNTHPLLRPHKTPSLVLICFWDRSYSGTTLNTITLPVWYRLITPPCPIFDKLECSIKSIYLVHLPNWRCSLISPPDCTDNKPLKKHPWRQLFSCCWYHWTKVNLALE